jgi:hypothetical protein
MPVRKQNEPGLLLNRFVFYILFALIMVPFEMGSFG